MTPIEPFRDEPPRSPVSAAGPAKVADNFFSQITIAPGPPPRDPNEVFQETLWDLTPSVYMTWGLLAINVLVYLAMLARGVHFLEPTGLDLLGWGANFGPKTLDGQWWRLLSCAFVHIGIIHLAMNMFCLASAGPLVERMVGNAGFLVLYLAAALGGSVASLLWNPVLVSAGASGAVFGIYGALLTLPLRQHGSIPGDALTNVRNSGLVFVGYNLIYGFTQPNIDNAAHLGGLLTGLAGGLVLSQPLTLESLDGRWLRNVALAGVALLLVGGGLWFVDARYGDLGASQRAWERLGKVEEKAMEDFKAVAEPFDRGEISGESFANVVESKLLPPWKDLLAEFRALHRLPPRRQEFVAALTTYMQARQEVWELLAQAARENNPQKFAAAQAKGPEVNRAVEAVQAIWKKGA